MKICDLCKKTVDGFAKGMWMYSIPEKIRDQTNVKEICLDCNDLVREGIEKIHESYRPKLDKEIDEFLKEKFLVSQ